MNPGDSFTTNILYLINKALLTEENEIYLALGDHHIAKYDSEVGRIMPIEHDTRIRFLRIYPKVTD